MIVLIFCFLLSFVSVLIGSLLESFFLSMPCFLQGEVLIAGMACCFFYGGTHPIAYEVIILSNDILNFHPAIFVINFVQKPLTSLKTFFDFLKTLDCKTRVIITKQVIYKMDKFNKIVDLYKGKYKLNIADFLGFMYERVNCPQEMLAKVEEFILEKKRKNDSFSEEELTLYFHAIAAVQENIVLTGKNLNTLSQYIRIGKFKSKKQKAQKEEKTQKDEKPIKQTKVDTAIQKKKITNINEVSKEQQQKQQIKAFLTNNEKPKVQIKEKSKPQNKINQNNDKNTNIEQTKQKQNLHSPKRHIQQQLPMPIIVESVSRQDVLTAQFQINKNDTGEYKLNSTETINTIIRNPISITGYDKFGQVLLNPIIKFKIENEGLIVYHSYEQFQNLMNYINRQYEGLLLPDLPPKQSIKSTFSYFWGLDQKFLNQRQHNLEQMINTLLRTKYVNEDEVLLNFLSNQDYQVQASGSSGFIGYLTSIKTVNLNVKYLANYGVAYYNYFKHFRKTDIVTEVTKSYEEIEEMLNYCVAIQNYRNTINANFKSRRELLGKCGQNIGLNPEVSTEFDSILACSAMQIKNLKKQMEKYIGLKSQESWFEHLLNQANETETDAQLRNQKQEIQNRISKMSQNLLGSIELIRTSKTEMLSTVQSKMMNWRRKIHP